MMTAQEFNRFKELLKQEFERRGLNRDMTKYIGTKYDFKVVPEKGHPMLSEHKIKTYDLFCKVFDLDKLGLTMESLMSMSYSEVCELLDRLSHEIVTGETVETAREKNKLLGTNYFVGEHTSCLNSCTGLCLSTCSHMCTSCSSTCVASLSSSVSSISEVL